MDETNRFVAIDDGLNTKSIVRRYLDLPKYLDLLRSRALYFRRADSFADKFEGAMPAGIRQAFRSSDPPQDPDVWYERTRLGHHVCCWNHSAQDNMALWQLYGGTSLSVAVTSTIERLVGCALDWPQNVHVSKVRYLDLHRSPSNLFLGRYHDLLRLKHKAFSYEKELRLIVPALDGTLAENPVGIRLPIGDLNVLIRSIVVGPEAQDWFVDLVTDITRKYGVASPVRRSRLTYLPR